MPELKNVEDTLPEVIEFIRKKNYKGIKWLGKGSFGLTALIEDETINEKFVCKKYSPQYGIDREKYYTNFLNEIKLMYKLNHNNIVRVFNYYMYKEAYTGFVLMEYIDGVNIKQFLKDFPEMINSIFEQVIDGFSYLESKKILHRDIRYSNILVDNGGFVKIIDFGFGKQISTIEDFDRSFSSLNWWCQLPEDFNEKMYDFKTEIYFVGKMFEKIIDEDNISGFNYSVILSNMCKINPKDRFESFNLIKRSIQSSEDIEELFDENEIEIYQDFASDLSIIISILYQETAYIDDIDVVQKKLSDLYRKVMLEANIPDNSALLNCFFDGPYRYKTRNVISTRNLKSFINLLKNCTKDKKNIILSNLHSRFDAIDRIENDVQQEEIPF